MVEKYRRQEDEEDRKWKERMELIERERQYKVDRERRERSQRLEYERRERELREKEDYLKLSMPPLAADPQRSRPHKRYLYTLIHLLLTLLL